jgi:cellulose synthase/poly-beta-1,6-N-acetylglucosamine synthase-like glycosyltransferase
VTEDRAAFERTIHSIVRSNYPKEKLYMLFIVDGNRARSFESLMETLHDEPYTSTAPPFIHVTHM